MHISVWMESDLLTTYCPNEVTRTSARNSRYLSDPYPKITSDSCWLIYQQDKYILTQKFQVRVNHSSHQELLTTSWLFVFASPWLFLFSRTFFWGYPNLCFLNCNSSFVCLFLFLFSAALGLCCCKRAFSRCGKQGLLFVAVHGLLTAVASLVAEHRL